MLALHWANAMQTDLSPQRSPPGAGPVAGASFGSDQLWYFAYGSMVNPTSLRRREILPVCSSPAVLQGYELIFNLNGMANLAVKDTYTHGVVHCISTSEFDTLKMIELSYDVIDVTVECYGSSSGEGRTVAAKTFCVPPGFKAKTSVLPSERYIKIIVQGLIHYNVDPLWVATVQEKQYSPSKQASEYLKVPPAMPIETMPVWSPSQLGAHQGKSPYVLAIGEKVIQVGLSEAETTHMYEQVLKELSGREVTYQLCMRLYDPSLPDITCPEDICAAHQEWVEDTFMEFSKAQNAELLQIARLSLHGVE